MEVLDWAAHLEHLKVALKEFDLAVTLNKEIMIRYFREGLRPSIRAQLNARGRKLDSWKEAIEKTVDIEANALLQSSSSTRKMDSSCPQGNKPAKKEKKDSKRTKSINTPFADAFSSKHQQSST